MVKPMCHLLKRVFHVEKSSVVEPVEVTEVYSWNHFSTYQPSLSKSSKTLRETFVGSSWVLWLSVEERSFPGVEKIGSRVFDYILRNCLFPINWNRNPAFAIPRFSLIWICRQFDRCGYYCSSCGSMETKSYVNNRFNWSSCATTSTTTACCSSTTNLYLHTMLKIESAVDAQKFQHSKQW